MQYRKLISSTMSISFFMLFLTITCKQPTTGIQSQGDINKIVSISFPKSLYTFTLAQVADTIAVPYQIQISNALSSIYAVAQATCVEPDSTGLIFLEELYGNGQTYCKCDNGFCFYAQYGYLRNLSPRNHQRRFVWQGRNWYGFSDTGNPLGAPFPAGVYTLRVSANGHHKVDNADVNFRIADSVQIVLTN
jgi:hypothetical protein